ncbi:MAG: DUF4129 domain-containing protein [Gemmatimonadales bacterium]
MILPLPPAPLGQIPSADSLRAVLREVFSGREYQWGRPATALAWLEGHFLRLLDWLDRLREANPLGYYALLIMMVAVLGLILLHFAYILWRAFRRVEPHQTQPLPALGAARDSRWYLKEARALAAAGCYAEALAHRFVALVLELDGRRALQFHPSKTPAEYVAEARLEDATRSLFGQLVTALYRHLFGAVPCTAAEWAQFDAQAATVRGAAAGGGGPLAAH